MYVVRHSFRDPGLKKFITQDTAHLIDEMDAAARKKKIEQGYIVEQADTDATARRAAPAPKRSTRKTSSRAATKRSSRTAKRSRSTAAGGSTDTAADA